MFKQPRRVDKLWGYETIIDTLEWVGVHPGYTGKILTVLPNGNACSIHFHRRKIETFYVMRGALALELFLFEIGKSAIEKRCSAPGRLQPYTKEWCRINVVAGRTIRIPAYMPHRFWAIGGEVAEFVEVSTPDDPADSYRIVESGPSPK
jgi:mannose-6-phosphate isomerase-like protein (cupin superfamily)